MSMIKPYIVWAIVGMVGYSFTSLFVKLSTQSARFTGFAVLVVASIVVAASAAGIAIADGSAKSFSVRNIESKDFLFVVLAGISLTVAVSSFFKALSLGPANVVVPIYGMFIVGGSALGVLFLHESMTSMKAVGICFAVASIFFITRR